jgi:FtsZ-interacting cell division protein ZipA
MKLMRVIFVVIILVVVIALLWNFLPGFRESARSTYRKHGGWTEKARQSDPVGFIEYAEGELSANLTALTDARAQMKQAQKSITDEQQKTEKLLSSADALALQFRTAYQAAEKGGTYPVDVAGATYDRHALVEQVRLILLQKENYVTILKDLAQAASAAKAKEEQLVTQIASTQASLAALPAKKEIARVNELTGRTAELLGQVNELITQNTEVLEESPIRTVEQLVASAKPKEEEQSSIDVQAFLEGGQ